MSCQKGPRRGSLFAEFNMPGQEQELPTNPNKATHRAISSQTNIENVIPSELFAPLALLEIVERTGKSC